MRQISEKHAKELALTARMFSAEDAYRFGLVNILCEPGSALTRALSLAQEICKGAPLAVQATKQMMDQGRGITELETAFATTYPVFERMINSLDADEGRRAPAPPSSVQARSSTKAARTAPVPVAEPLGCLHRRSSELREAHLRSRRAAEARPPRAGGWALCFTSQLK